MDSSAPVPHLSVPVHDLEVARRFYVEALGCRLGRERDDWFDVWFFGMQLTLQLRPGEVRPPAEQGVRHFGVALSDVATYAATVDRLDRTGVEWLSAPGPHDEVALSGKVGGKLADPSGNVIEIKYYADPERLHAD